MLTPLPRSEWTSTLAAHLLNRAGFGGSPAEISRTFRMGPTKAVDNLVEYQAIAENSSPPTFAQNGPPEPIDRRAMRKLGEKERQKKRSENRRKKIRDMMDLGGWWMNRMLTSPRPLQEKLTLFWHGHFATGFRKVRIPYVMYLQNQTMRRHANGSWEEFLIAMNRDPAMLLYLDGVNNRRKAPNENYARELMELFTLGEGHYTEKDIREAARALTGWTINRRQQRGEFHSSAHDHNKKTFHGKTGNFDDGDIIRIILNQPTAATFIVRKLWEFFAYINPEEDLIDKLAGIFRDNEYRFSPVLKAMFRSREFYSTKAGRTQIKSPVQWLISSLKYLEAPLPPVPMISAITNSLGQQLFEPPNVKGWEGGATWITTDSLLKRYNFASMLVEGGKTTKGLLEHDLQRSMRMYSDKENMEGQPLMSRRTFTMQQREVLYQSVMDPDKILPETLRTTAAQVQGDLQWRLFQSTLQDQNVAVFRTFFDALPEPNQWNGQHIREVVHAMMSTPQYQLT